MPKSLKKILANCASLSAGLHYCCSKVRFMNVHTNGYVAIEEQVELMNDVRQLSWNGGLACVACMEPISILLYTRMYILSNRRADCCLSIASGKG